MRISQQSEYALRAMFDLSQHDPEELVKVSCIASRRGIPQKFLESILLSLRRGGFVDSRRGRDGGYRLARPADMISVGEVLKFFEWSPRGHGFGESEFIDLWNQVDQSVSAIVDRTTFADLTRRRPEQPDVDFAPVLSDAENGLHRRTILD